MSGPGTRLLLATTNRGKIAELAPMLAAHGLHPVGLHELPAVPVAVEDGDTFAANARAKAGHYAQLTGLPALADDSGLVVPALGGAPGVHSARYAGPAASDADNRAKLLAALADGDDRRAEFVCALCLHVEGAVPLVVTGHCRGTLARAERGRGGFGYDSLFVPDDPAAGGRTFAELDAGEKTRCSHRGEALRRLEVALGPYLSALGGVP